jgi:hypothetical protein
VKAGGALVPGGRGSNRRKPQQEIRKKLKRLLPGCLEKKRPLGLTHFEKCFARGFADEKTFRANSEESSLLASLGGSQKDFPKNIRRPAKKMTTPKGILKPGRGMGNKKGSERRKVMMA